MFSMFLLMEFNCFFFFFVFSFFFQAEDGIRDLVRSRGLGDVYKRQALVGAPTVGTFVGRDWTKSVRENLREAEEVFKPLVERAGAVSYTHLTLPTSDLV